MAAQSIESPKVSERSEKKPAKPKLRKLTASFLVCVPVPFDILAIMSKKDRDWLFDLEKTSSATTDNRIGQYRLEDIIRVRNLLRSYECTIAYPSSKTLRQYGLKHSGDSMRIYQDGNIFVIEQYFPDGELKVFRVSHDVVWTLYYAVKEYFDSNASKETVESSVLWEVACRKFNLDRFFDKNGHFHADSFFGARNYYFRFWYYPAKVLSSFGEPKIIYNGSRVSLPKKGA